MELRILGCSGGIGAGRETTSFLLDGTILLDAGSGVGELSLEEMKQIRHIFLTHSHLDHIHCIPLFIDSIFDSIETPIQIHALPDTIKALKAHLFNGLIWPDFSILPTPDTAVIKFVPMEPGELYSLDDVSFEMIPVNHIVPTVGYRVSGPNGVFAFSGDTTTNDSFWEGLNRYPQLDMVIVESAFSNAEEKLAHLARHYCPTLLATDLSKLKLKPKVYLTHAKPGEEDTIFQECQALITDRQLYRLSGKDIFTL